MSFVLVQCTKESTNEPKSKIIDNQSIELRSQAPENIVYPPLNCGPEDFNDIKCGTKERDTLIVTTDSGCEIEVSMDIQSCLDVKNNIFELNFSNLHYHFIFPISSECSDYFNEYFWAKPVGEINDALDDFEDELADKFQEQWMTAWVIKENAECPKRYGTSRFFKATCVQRCLTPPSEDRGPSYYSIVQPCATDGCCVDVAHYCLYEGQVIKIYDNTITISPCTNFFTVDCGNLYPWGDCRDKGCSD